MNIEKINSLLLTLCLIGIFYLVYYQNIYFPKKLQNCYDVAIGLERARHQPNDDLQITNTDIAGYMKNLTSCLSD
jgi:hypothetical protein